MTTNGRDKLIVKPISRGSAQGKNPPRHLGGLSCTDQTKELPHAQSTSPLSLNLLGCLDRSRSSTKPDASCVKRQTERELFTNCGIAFLHRILDLKTSSISLQYWPYIDQEQSRKALLDLRLSSTSSLRFLKTGASLSCPQISGNLQPQEV